MKLCKFEINLFSVSVDLGATIEINYILEQHDWTDQGPDIAINHRCVDIFFQKTYTYLCHVQLSTEMVQVVEIWKKTYCKLSDIRRTKSQNLNDSHLVLQLSLTNLLRPGVK